MWPYGHGSTVMEGWKYAAPLEDLDESRLLGATSEPIGIQRGTHRWTEWVLGRHAAAKAASRAGAIRPVIDVSAEGAPYVRGSDVGLSIAHTRGLVLAAAAQGAIGIDVERADRDVSRLVRSLRTEERKIANAVGVVGSLVVKEAVAKATGRGLGGSLSRWPLLDAEISGATPTVSVATPEGQIVTAQLFPWRGFIVGIALMPRR